MVIVTFLVAVVGWRLARRLGLMAPSMLGPMIAVGATNVIFGYAQMPTWVRVFAQGISGAFIAMSITKADIRNMRRLAAPGALLLAMLTLNTLAMGVVIHELCGIDLMTSLFSCIAGGVTDTTLISMDYGTNVGTVALMQTSRLVMVLLIFPYWIRFMCRNEAEEPAGQLDELDAGGGLARSEGIFGRLTESRAAKTVLTVILALVLALLGKASGIPAASMVLPLVAVAALNITKGVCAMPVPVKDAARLLAGSLVGTDITASTFSSLQTTLIPVLLLFASYWVLNLVFGLICSRTGLLDLKSALFVSSPGGASDMALIAADLDAPSTPSPSCRPRWSCSPDTSTACSEDRAGCRVKRCRRPRTESTAVDSANGSENAHETLALRVLRGMFTLSHSRCRIAWSIGHAKERNHHG